jgi:hypothetical protein
MVLYACMPCVVYSRFVENPPIDPEVTNPLFLRWFCHIHAKVMITELHALLDIEVTSKGPQRLRLIGFY